LISDDGLKASMINQIVAKALPGKR